MYAHASPNLNSLIDMLEIMRGKESNYVKYLLNKFGGLGFRGLIFLQRIHALIFY